MYFMANTSKCVYPSIYKNYYLNKTDLHLYPCSLYKDTNCYECDPYLNNEGICLSCIQGYQFNMNKNKCEKCKYNEYGIVRGNFYQCTQPFKDFYCDLYTTTCISKENDEIICPDDAPFYNNKTKSCHEYECLERSSENGVCISSNEKNKDKILFVNWFISDLKDQKLGFPSYNVDKSGNLMIELTYNVKYIYEIDMNLISQNRDRKLYFYNEEGRGFFDVINDKYEKNIELGRKLNRFISTSMVLKLNNSEEYRYFINFENSRFNLELIDLKTGESSGEQTSHLFLEGLCSNVGPNENNVIQLLNEKNKYFFAQYMRCSESTKEKLYVIMFSLYPNQKDQVNIYSLKIIKYYILDLSDEKFNLNEKFFVAQTQKGHLIVSIVTEFYILCVYNWSTKNISAIDYIFESAFHKLLFIKDEINCICFYTPFQNYFNILSIIFFEFETEFKIIDNFYFQTRTRRGTASSTDILFLSETKAIMIVHSPSGKNFYIYEFNFFDDYQNYLYEMIILNQFEQKYLLRNRFSLLFKYKDLLGLQIENIEGSHGFILFGYINSTDPKQIYNIKKEGLNYSINLKNYLYLQSNIFSYKLKNIKIVEVPNLNESGIYLISNITKDIIKAGDYIDLDTKISLSFSYNGIIKKGNYLFKFVGVLQEPTFEEKQNDFDYYLWSINDEKIEKYIEIYNNRRNMNITGRVALVQINVLNDTKVYCDKKYDDSVIKKENGKFLTCGKGKFYDIENADEITQYNLGINYYFDQNKNEYIKYHKKCKTCSKKYNITNFNCDDCFENYYLRNGLCLEIPNCEYNYYYDDNFELKCIKRETSCPDVKPYEENKTKECIENCNIDEFNNYCNPTNNLISINETYENIMKNIEYLNIKEKLLEKKEKYTIIGNNVSFFFSTSKIEKEELNLNLNSSSILFSECENILKSKYSISQELSIPILKIETLHNYSILWAYIMNYLILIISLKN